MEEKNSRLTISEGLKNEVYYSAGKSLRFRILGIKVYALSIFSPNFLLRCEIAVFGCNIPFQSVFFPHIINSGCDIDSSQEGMHLDSLSLTLSWKDMNAWTKPTMKQRKKKLLENVSGIAKSGSLTAILSPSGGGKTTLLAILNRRFKGITSGELLLNGVSVTPKQMAIISGYVCQKECIFDNLLVQEHLDFMARLRMDRDMTDEERRKAVLKIVKNLVLSHRLSAPVSLLSGGQRKRLALAVQLLTEPCILFCDEPTTGLDSFSAKTVMLLLRKLSEKGKMIICAIHQPTSGIFEMFDDVSILVSSGSLAYHGPVSLAADYFANLGFKCPEAYDLSEFLVSQVTVRYASVTDCNTDLERVENIVQSFQTSKCNEDLMSRIATISPSEKRVINNTPEKKRLRFYVEFQWLLWRTALLMKRSYRRLIVQFLLYFMVMTCIGLVCGVIVIDQTGVSNVQGLLYSFLIEIVYLSVYSVLFTFPYEMPIFVQESADHLYSPFGYYTSKLVVMMLKALIDSFVFSNYVLCLTGLNRSLMDCILSAPSMFLCALTASGYGFLLSTAFDSITTASLFSVPFELVCTIFAGIYIRLSSLPWYLVWMKYTSFIYYAYEAISIEIWSRHEHIYCGKETLNQCSYLSGDQVLKSYGFSRADVLLDYVGLCLICLAFHSVAFHFFIRRIKVTAAY